MLPEFVLGGTAAAPAAFANVTLKHGVLSGVVEDEKVPAVTVNATIAPAAPCTFACVADTVKEFGKNSIPVPDVAGEIETVPVIGAVTTTS
jgi:hypothetical protein